MKVYTIKTKFGVVSMPIMFITHLINSSPVTIYGNKNKTVFDNISSYITKKTSRNGYWTKRFASIVMNKYMEYALTMMIEQGVKVPITDKGIFMAIGSDCLAVTKKNYTFDIRTMGAVYTPVFSIPDNISKSISYTYRIRLHPSRQADLDKQIDKGAVYPEYKPQYITKFVNDIYEKLYFKRKKKLPVVYGYAIKL